MAKKIAEALKQKMEDNVVNALVSVIWHSKLARQDNIVKFLWYYIKGKPCKKCIIQPCCTVVCWPKIYYNTGRERVHKVMKWFNLQ